MFAGLTIDGAPIAVMEEDTESVCVEFDPQACAPQYRCRACGQELAETVGGFESDTHGACCPDFEPSTEEDPDLGEGPHDPEAIPLAWCNQASIITDRDDDAITVTVSVGDPRGAFALTLRRVPDDADSAHAGRLVMHVPHPDQSWPHMETTALHPGTYLLGPCPAARRRRDAA